MAVRRSAKKKSDIVRRRVPIPENVYKVVPKRMVRQAKKKKSTHKKTTLAAQLQQTVPPMLLIVIGVAIVGFALTAIVYATQKISHDIQRTNETIAAGAYSKDTVQRMRLIGKPDTYPAEIANYQSAPDDLQLFILDDYKMLKTQCIVNGSFAGEVSYAIVNVVYDSFARIEKNCNGTDTLMLKKMSGIWTVIYSGNDLPKCSDVNAFGIPQGISYKCRDGYITYTNPNP